MIRWTGGTICTNRQGELLALGTELQSGGWVHQQTGSPTPSLADSLEPQDKFPSVPLKNPLAIPSALLGVPPLARPGSILCLSWNSTSPLSLTVSL